MEKLEQLICRAAGQPDASIGDGELPGIRDSGGSDAYDRSSPSVLEGVRDQVGEHLNHSGGVTDDRWELSDLDHGPLSLDLATQRLECLLQQPACLVATG